MKLKFCKELILSLSLSMAVFASCSKVDSSASDMEPNMEGTYIKVNLKGVVDIEQTKLSAHKNNEFLKISSVNLNKKSSESADNMVSVGKSLEALTNVSSLDFSTINDAIDAFNDSDGEVGNANEFNNFAKKQLLNKLASSVVQPDVKSYRLLIFDEDGKNISIGNEISTRKNVAIKVQANKKYKWVVVSTGEDELPPITNDGRIAKADLQNKNILYASDFIYTTEGENSINVILKNHRVRYDVVIDARGVFGKITPDSKISLGRMVNNQFQSIIQNGDLDLVTGEYTNIETVDHIALGSMMRDTLSTGGSVKKYSFYTIDKSLINENSLTLKFHKFGVNVSSPTPQNPTNLFKREFADNRLATFAHAEYKNNYNGYYDVNIKLIDVGMPVQGLIWARTNLILDENGAYVFRSNNDFKGEIDKDYWNFKAKSTGRLEGESTEDPCAKVYPHNVWRTPNKDEFDKLIKGKRDILEKNGLFYGKRYVITWKLDDNSTIDNGYVEANNIDNSNNTLSLIFGGYRNNAQNKLERSPFGIGELFSLGQAHYWTRDEVKNENKKAYMLYGGILEFLGYEMLSSKTQSGSTDVGRFIRCVRSANISTKS